jgi:Zn-dependent M16 (insulinase) family peptidase
VCNELNLFTKLKDKQYFDTVVRPYVRAKMEKFFMDYYLLEDACVFKYASMDMIDQLNCLEKCLLINAMVSHNHKPEFAKNLVERMKMELSSNGD